MIPVLFNSVTKNFETGALGFLVDAISCIVTEELNGAYELEMEYPKGGRHFDEIETGCQIMAFHEDSTDQQVFRIYKIEKTLSDTFKIYARHLSYDLNKITNYGFFSSTILMLLTRLKENTVTDNPFNFSVDREIEDEFSSAFAYSINKPVSVRGAIGGDGIPENIIDFLGCEVEWNNFNVVFHKQRGEDRGAHLRYGKNMTDLQAYDDISEVCSAIVAYYVYDDGRAIRNPIYPYSEDWAYSLTLDFTQEVNDLIEKAQEGSETPIEITDEIVRSYMLQATEEYYTREKPWLPVKYFSASYADLRKSTEFADLPEILLGDTVSVEYVDMGISEKMRVVKIEYDVLAERNSMINVGLVPKDVASTITDVEMEMNRKIKAVDKKIDRRTADNA